MFTGHALLKGLVAGSINVVLALALGVSLHLSSMTTSTCTRRWSMNIFTYTTRTTNTRTSRTIRRGNRTHSGTAMNRRVHPARCRPHDPLSAGDLARMTRSTGRPLTFWSGK